MAFPSQHTNASDSVFNENLIKSQMRFIVKIHTASTVSPISLDEFTLEEQDVEELATEAIVVDNDALICDSLVHGLL